mgnify:CR=1 FL=1|tara:strand:+ start:6119 stop:6256 length:138 start_codon:yes stop_codon:yes gene_type:complete
MKKEKKFRQYRSNQGRSPERQSNAEKILMWAIVGIIIMVTVLAAI